MTLEVCETAPAGAVTFTAPPCAENVVPPAETSPPSLTVTVDASGFPFRGGGNVALPIATPVTRPAATVTFESSELDHVMGDRRASFRFRPSELR